jgi:hypothetical protein
MKIETKKEIKSQVEMPRMRIYDHIWFTLGLERSAMNLVNVFSFYKLGRLLQDARSVKLSSADVKELLIVAHAGACLTDFLRSDEAGLRRSRESAKKVLDELEKLETKLRHERTIEDHEILGLWGAVEDFGVILESESGHDLRIFSVTPKGIYDRTKLVDHAEAILGQDILDRLPQEIQTDMNLAGRCFAFELWTATGFHAMRAVEAITRRYHQVVVKNPAPDVVTLGGFITELEKELQKEEGTKVSDSPLGLIVATLRRVNKIYRIPVMHPNMTLTEDTAKRVFELAANVIPTICDDLLIRSRNHLDED